jgi:hypothetical protein
MINGAVRPSAHILVRQGYRTYTNTLVVSASGAVCCLSRSSHGSSMGSSLHGTST